MSIIRPLKGVDLELEANLRSSFIQSYPKFEIIFSVASPKDPAIKIVNQLCKEFEHVDSRLIIGKTKKGVRFGSLQMTWIYLFSIFFFFIHKKVIIK